MTIETRPILYARVACGGCSRRFECDVYAVPNFRGVPSCEPCLIRLNDLRERLGLAPWVYPDRAYPRKEL